jgi:hypothetical protein
LTVSITELHRHLNITDDCDDILLQTLLDAATASVGVLVDPMPESGTPDIDLAIMQLVTFWFENRDGRGTIPDGVHELLGPYRTWFFG